MKISDLKTFPSHNELPRLMIITSREGMRPSTLEALRVALEGGARLVQLREKDLSSEEIRTLAVEVKKLCGEFDAEVLINHKRDIAREIGAGLHLPESEIETLAPARQELANGVLCGAAAHSFEAAHRAQEQGADYVVFGSVFETASHPGRTPAGIEALRETCQSLTIPVLAVGGITSQNARSCLDVGAHGVAVIRSVWSSPDAGKSVREFLQILHH